MFEAIVTLCLVAQPDICRDHLLPGYEAQTRAACEAALAADRPALDVDNGLERRGPPDCAETGEMLSFTEVAPGVFVHTGRIAEPDAENGGDVANIGFVIGGEGVAVIDSGSARWMGEALWRGIRGRTDLPVSHVILTHLHPDHVLGATPLVDAGAVVVGHAGLPRALADRQVNYLESFTRLIGLQRFLGTRAPVVEIAVSDGMEIDLGNRILDLRAWPTAHSGSDLTVLDRETGTLFAGDLVFDLHVPALDGRLRGWRDVLKDLQAVPAARVVPGHGGPVLPWPAGAEPTRRYLEVLERDTRAALDEGQRLATAVEHVARSEAAAWDLFEAYNPRNATVAFTELEWE